MKSPGKDDQKDPSQSAATQESLKFQAPYGARLDCAYFLLLGACIAAVFIVAGGAMTYVAFTNMPAHEVHQIQHHHTGKGIPMSSLQFIGPISIAIGMLGLVVLFLLTVYYGCDYRPPQLERFDSGYVNFVMMDETGKSET